MKTIPIPVQISVPFMPGPGLKYLGLQYTGLRAMTLAVVATASLLLSPMTMAGEVLEKGRAIAFDRKKGNCLACHYIAGGTLMGNTGPALVAMKARFPKRQDLVTQISDARVKNLKTIMPPFGSHEILTKQEIDWIVTWLYTL
ncbi:MAG: sulfur-oxidizing protein SoxX [Phenylobacterium sp.]|jgi:sulfur-oxidizing protein SoxX